MKLSAEKLRLLVTRLLLAFVLVSLGYSWGVHSNQARGQTQADQSSGLTQGQQVRVIYMHSTFGCETCNTIERMARTLVEERYPEALGSGRLRWEEADFLVREDLARPFGVVAPCVVVVRMVAGQVLDFRRLDEVWTRMEEPAQFNAYLVGAIDALLRTGA